MTEAIFVKFIEDTSEFKKGEIYTTHQKGLTSDIKGVISQSDAELYLEYKYAEKVNSETSKKISNSAPNKIDDRTLFRLDIAQELANPQRRRDVTEKLAEDFLDNNDVYTTMNDDKNEVWIYREGIYIPNGISIIREYVRNITNKAYTTHLANEVVAKIMADTFISEDEFYNTNYPDLVPVQNGILNIHTKELIAFNPKYIFFGKLPVSFNPEAKCPVVLEFLNSIQPNDEKKVKFLLEIAGYCLYKKYPLHKWFLFEGKGRNGKGAYFRLLESLLGHENTKNITIQDLEEKEYAVSDLHGKYANIGGDIPSRPLKNTARIKALTGEDKVSVNRKFKTYLSFVNYSKQIFSANELPEVMDFSDGFWDRLCYLFFPVRFVDSNEYERAENKTNLALKSDIETRMQTPEELSGFLNLALQHLEELLERGCFSYNLGIEKIKAMYLRQSDNVVAFVEDCCEKSYQYFITKDDFREKYVDYCEKNGLIIKSDKDIKHTMQEKLGIVERQKLVPSDSNLDLNQQEFDKKRVWLGLRLK